MAEKVTARKKQANEMRSRIRQAALDLFDKEGFENVSVEQIAQAAGCSVGNIYHYFKSKDELSLQLTANVDRIYSELAEQYQLDLFTPAIDKLLDFMCRALQISAEDEYLYRAFAQAMKYPEQGVLKDNGKRVYHNLLRTLVCSCQAEGSISAVYTADEVVQMLVAFHRGMLFEWRVYQGGFDLVDRGRTMAKALLKGLK